MTHKTLTRADLLQAVYVMGPGLSRVEAKDIVESVLDTLCGTLVNGDPVKLRGFGTFNIRTKRPRIGRNPKTGHEYPITARRVMTFKPSPRLVAAVNGEVAEPGADEDDPGETIRNIRNAAHKARSDSLKSSA